MNYILYLSSSTELLSEDQLAEILFISRKNNSIANITGILLYVEGTFLQLLEADKASILDEVYSRIRTDRRHFNIMEMLRGSHEKRIFPDWSMGFHSITKEEFSYLSGYKDITEISFTSKTEENKSHPGLTFLKNFYEDQQKARLI